VEQDSAQPPKYRHIGYGPIAAIIVTVSAFFGAQIIVGLLIGLLPAVMRWEIDRVEALLAESVPAKFLIILFVEVLTLWLLWLFVRSRKVTLKSIGLVRPEVRDISYAIVGYVAYFALFIAISIVAKAAVPGLDLNQEQEIGFSRGTSGGALWLVFASLVILPPVTEEIVMRGFLYTGLRNKLPKLAAAFITSVLFAAAHLQWGSGNALLWVAALDTFVLSMILVYLRDKTGSLWSPILVHMFKNGLAFVLLFIYKVV